jgi:hypothetical protein
MVSLSPSLYTTDGWMYALLTWNAFVRPSVVLRDFYCWHLYYLPYMYFTY